MTLLTKLLALFVLMGTANTWAAGSASAIIGGGAVKGTSGWTVKGPTATAANGAFVTPATVTAAGKQVTMPATATIAANAASFAVSAVRLNPAGLVVGLTAQWLLGQGLSYVNNEWKKSSSPVADPNLHGQGWEWCNGVVQDSCGNVGAFPFGSSAEAERDYIWNYFYPGQTWQLTRGPFCLQTIGAECVAYRWINDNAQGGAAFIDTAKRSVCYSGYTLQGGNCVAQAVQVAATESDFTAAAAQPITDGAAQELARANVPMPVNDPVMSQAPKVEDYGNPFVDPVTGKTVQTKTRITPDPLPGDPYNVRIESYNVEVSPAPAPVPGDPVPVPAEEQPKDPCLDNPDRVGCLNAGSPEDTSLTTWELPFSLTPVSIGGAGACPPDPVFNAAGQTFTISYKPMCDAAIWLKPLILAMAWFVAAGIIAGTVRET